MDFKEIGIDLNNTDINNQKGDVSSHDIISRLFRLKDIKMMDLLTIDLICGYMPYVHLW